MKVLLSAYACEPDKGSEPGVGWHWAIEIARRGHKVTVLTRANNRTNIEAYIAMAPSHPSNIEFVYYDLPPVAIRLKQRMGTTLLYYGLWQCGAYRLARRLHIEKKFELVHHITFGSMRHFSFMGNLGIPFILGPIGGGETSPFWLRCKVGVLGASCDTLRDVLNTFSLFDPIAKRAFSSASMILVKTEESLKLIPPKFHYKSRVQLEIGINMPTNKIRAKVTDRSKRIIFIGRFIYWKGMYIGLRSYAKALENDPTLNLTMVGDGVEANKWRNYAENLGIADKICWTSWLPQAQLAQVYTSSGVLLFPSLHDSSGNVVLESLSHGIPVVCFNLGGPSKIINSNCGRVISTEHGNYELLTDRVAQALLYLTETSETWEVFSAKAKKEAEKWSWAGRVEGLGVY